MPNFSAIRTNSVNDQARIFCMTPTLDVDGKFGSPELSGNLFIE
jgi:hypothetical protein